MQLSHPILNRICLSLDNAFTAHSSHSGHSSLAAVWLALTILATGISAEAASPLIMVQPMSQTVVSGGPASFNVTATGDSQLQYQWRKNGTSLSGQTSASLTIAAATSADAGDYSVMVFSSSGATSSSTARLTVGAIQLPSIVSQPSSQTVSAGGNATFQVVASGSQPFAYQWKKNGFNLSGQASATLTLQSVTSADAGAYSVSVANAAGATASANAMLTVTTPSSPVLVTQPSSQTVPAGSSVTLSVTAAGSGQLQYQWKKEGIALAAQTSATFSVSSATALDAGNYSVSVSNSSGTTNSANATVTVTATMAPSITSGPINTTVSAGSRATLTVSASGSTPLSFQWRRNGINLSGQTSAILVLNNCTSADAGSYSVQVSNSMGSQTSADATLTVTGAVAQAPGVAVNPVSQTVSAGANVTLFVTATGSGPLSFQWKRNGVDLAGETSAALQINSATSANAGDYAVVVSNDTGTAASATATITIAASSAPSIAVGPISQTTTASGTVTFVVQASGSGPVSYQWMKNGVSIAGANSATLTLQNVQASDIGSYQVIVQNSSGAAASSEATLSIGAQAQTVDSSFAAVNVSNVTAVVVQADGKVIIVGGFTHVGGVPRNRIARLNADGSLDLTFSGAGGANGPILALEPQADGRLVVAGSFTTMQGASANRISRLNADGSVDSSFNVGAGANDSIAAVKVQANGKIVVAGAFSQVNGSPRQFITRLNADGAVDASFNAGSGPNSPINDIKLQADGKVVIGGGFGFVSGVSRRGVARLNYDGSLDASFGAGILAGTVGTVSTIDLQTDGRILIGGSFSAVNGSPCSGLARLNADGTLDTSFITGLTTLASISSVRVQPDGRIIVGGQLNFAGIGALPDFAGRLNADGSLDTGLGSDLMLSLGSANNIEVQGNGSIYLAGNSTLLRVVSDILRPRLMASGKVTNSFSLSVQTRNGRTYILESKATADANNWTQIQTTPGDGSIKTMSDTSATASIRFYRVREQ